ncbi:hypothetical protein BDY19DRAFT_939425 [Irpex rosettiformis]|uniref:Uncharacterized protein n=1 Tax=Irpex rosettiformis TaxID=378272 RepID=A0ACB8U7U0_9APHY|nr:hypothetical protein BDY19DRAFT_939425 [Irpex rosettiformis]
MMATIPNVDGELPAYSQHVNARADPQVAHSFQLMKGEHPFLVVVLNSGAGSVRVGSESVPVLSQRQTLAGTVTLNLLEGMRIRSVTVLVIGELKKGYTVHRFLSMRRELYTVETGGDVTSPSTEAPGTSVRRKAWLTGHQLWQYSLKLPKGVSILCDGGPKSFRLPPTFVDRLGNFSIEYCLQVRIKTGFFNSDHKLICPFHYVPVLRPRLPSLLRQITQSEWAVASCPEDDPDGWKALPGVDITGVLFSSRRVQLTCELFVPLPLYYTRGAAVPIHLVISSKDDQTLDLLSSPHAPRVVFTRTMSFTPWQGSYAMGRNVNEPSETHTEQMASAGFTLIPGGGEERRVLRGQLVVPGHLVPEFRILNYTLEYSIAIYPFEVVGFSPSAPSRKPILQQTVQIATTHAIAPSLDPTQAPPTYTPTS